jgi:signal recognition particle GTPase
LFSPPIICVNSDSTNLIKACDGFSPRYLKERENKKVLVVSADVYRPAAIKQLAVLAQQVGVDFFPSNINANLLPLPLLVVVL